MNIKGLRILPPLAIGRLGSAPEPVDNFTIEEDPDRPLGYRRIIPRETLIVDPETGRIRESRTPDTITFKQKRRIRPVAPFLEVFALVEGEHTLRPLHEVLAQLRPAPKLEWRVRVANRKVCRRTGEENDIVSADTGWFSDHTSHRLAGKCRHFISDKASIDFGHVRFIDPQKFSNTSAEFPQIRLRFTPAKGLIYGPNIKQEQKGVRRVIPTSRAIYDHTKAWYGLGGPQKDRQVKNETLPPSLYAIKPPAPSWLNDNIAISRGYLDDTCDGFVEFRLTLPGQEPLIAIARICAGPPALVPDSLFVRSLADDLEQVIHGPKVAADEPFEVTRDRAADIIRRAYETVRFMNVALMNGNNFKGRPALLLDSMPEEEAADTQRAIRPVMGPGTVDTLAILALHEQVFAALRGGAAPWFLDLLRKPDEVTDFTDFGRRKMPALMCGADNNYLALTWRQIDTIRKAAEECLFHSETASPRPHAETAEPDQDPHARLRPRNLTAQLHFQAQGNPISSRPVSAIANCCPGLEVDFRAVWQRMFAGIVLREYENLIMEIDPGARDQAVCDPQGTPIHLNGKPLHMRDLKKRRLLRVRIDDGRSFDMMAKIKGPASSDPNGEITLTTHANPHGLAPLEWSNALARFLSDYQGRRVTCDITIDQAEDFQLLPEENPRNYVSVGFEVRPFFDDDTAVISQALADAGELTQGLCSPWQNDYRECSCYYWASARPDYINIQPGPDGLSRGDNWLQKKRTGSYVPDDYVDSRLVLYDDLFLHWEHWLRFQIGGTDAPEEKPVRSRGKRRPSTPTSGEGAL